MLEKYFKTELECKLFKRVCYLKMADCNTNPNVGFGPWPHGIVQDEAEYLGLKIPRENAIKIANEIQWPN